MEEASFKADEVLVSTAPILISNLRKRESFSIGLLSGVLSRTISSPIINISKDSNPSFSLLKSKVNSDDILSLWKGNLENSFYFGIKSGIDFVFYNTFYNRISVKQEVTPLKKITIGVLSNLISEFTTYPFLSLKTHPVSKTNGIFHALAEITTDDGILGLYRRLFSHLLLTIPCSAMRYIVNEKVLNHSKNPFLKYSISTALSFSLNYPTTYIKSMLCKHNDNGQFLYTFTDVIKNTYKEKGAMGFFNGYKKQFWKNVPLLAIQCTLVEEIQKGYLNLQSVLHNRKVKEREQQLKNEEDTIEEEVELPPPPPPPKFWKWEWF